MSGTEPFDLFIIGGGINGCGIARDAAGRGLSVGLAEMGDLAQATSSSSTKLFHGGLRYLEYFELRLVREALIEREVLLQAMPHISWPMRFVLPLHKDMRFDGETPASRLLSLIMPWMKGRRPNWMIRFGLLLYDHLGGRKILPGTSAVDLTTDPVGQGLQDRFTKAYEYSDCWVDDARLVVLNARDAVARGAQVMTRTKVVAARRDNDLWRISLQTETGPQEVTARALVNAAGPWVSETLSDIAHVDSQATIRLVRGSHIVTRRLFDHDKCYFLQGNDGRIIFAIPYEQDFTLIGTTDADHADPDDPARISETETEYLLDFANGYLKTQLTADDIVWTYSGVRPLYDDGAGTAQSATRDYVLKLNRDGAPLLSVFGGKITTYRKLAEHALEKLAPVLGASQTGWTAGVALPGGDLPVTQVAEHKAALIRRYPFLTEKWAERLFRAYGTEAAQILGDARSAADLGHDFGATLTEAELRWMLTREFAQGAADVLWRRSKLGLRLDDRQVAAVEDWIEAQL
ncbi:Aerobic glycerol-3-phosphate dehydrogenase [Thalassovita gelatinovora]|uniref:Glycerol-3-phosphate dehydrogenase n=1 Tax=Thalassovita gelatinovora TaxID=53501 RepID=A0A0P1FBZ9_THAGE|nr:glycerol-3-phosphate dehydrogenase [Thalassovita gelatinovora]QIZ80019.1 glycerol-3-phosphate dehydrogenase [Thalassovita gelatinovora]CUH65710.1 Aerobic glycerol-3-phosphate dehydrogenase [Thalassovita gelatinovora]SER04615.1 homodimeric glycerol 3-phosphate dehydrogenase (quinone) [Thalassovita gelatinovora]